MMTKLLFVFAIGFNFLSALAGDLGENPWTNPKIGGKPIPSGIGAVHWQINDYLPELGNDDNPLVPGCQAVHEGNQCGVGVPTTPMIAILGEFCKEIPAGPDGQTVPGPLVEIYTLDPITQSGSCQANGGPFNFREINCHDYCVNLDPGYVTGTCEKKVQHCPTIPFDLNNFQDSAYCKCDTQFPNPGGGAGGSGQVQGIFITD